MICIKNSFHRKIIKNNITDYYIKLPIIPITFGRKDFILTRCKCKRVLHLGCVDAGLLHERFLLNELMHQKLAEVATELWGMDINADGISFLRRQGFNNLIVGDICELDKNQELKGQHFDVIVASEVIEHLMNPGLFLETIQKLMIPSYTELIVTVPNAFRVDTLIKLLYGIEYVHPDHNYWFSYYTIMNLLKKSGFVIDEVCVYSFQATKIFPYKIVKQLFEKKIKKTNSIINQSREISFSSSTWGQIISYCKSLPKRLLIRLLYKTTPFWADGLIIVAKVTNHRI